MVAVGGGVGCLLQTLGAVNFYDGQGILLDLQRYELGASVHYSDLVGLQTWQPNLRFGNPRHVEPLCAQED